MVSQALSGDPGAFEGALREARRRNDRRVLLSLFYRSPAPIPEWEVPLVGEELHWQGVPLCWDERVARLFACDCAERVLDCFEEVYVGDSRLRDALGIGRAYAEGLLNWDHLVSAYEDVLLVKEELDEASDNDPLNGFLSAAADAMYSVLGAVEVTYDATVSAAEAARDAAYSQHSALRSEVAGFRARQEEVVWQKLRLRKYLFAQLGFKEEG
jgi:hypothetical protein